MKQVIAPLPGGRYSDVELGVRLDDIRRAAEKVLHPSMWLAVRRAAREMAVERNRADAKRPDVSGRSAAHRPLFEDRIATGKNKKSKCKRKLCR